MAEPSPETRPMRGFQFGIRLVTLFAVMAVGGVLVWMKANPLKRAAVRILLVAPEPEPEAGVSHYQARALALLMQDALESNPESAVTVASAMPENPEGIQRPEPWLLVKISPRRQQERLGLSLQWAWNSRLALGQDGWEKAEINPATPPEAFRRALAALPVELREAEIQKLFPASEARFWELVQAGTLRLQNTEREQALRLARSVTEQEPKAAEGWFTLGSLVYRGLLDSPESSGPERQAEAELCFRHGLKLVPDHPRGIFQLAQLQTNEGGHREAITLLLQALRKHPRNPLLLTGLVYSARNAGLLALAREAADRRDRWAFTEVQPLAIDVLFLYMGEFARFEATLKDQPGHLRNSVQRFFRGYLALIRKDKGQAIEAFRSAESVPRGYPHYLRLAQGFRLAAEGSLPEAREALRKLELDRVGLRVPDGEFTLRMAEGYALAGDLDHALELAERAFAQGFGATAWYEASPFLEPLRQSPRWRALIQHVRDRQALLESSFPVGQLPRE
jgi:tetratricopeptide (TPR) repeat protein